MSMNFQRQEGFRYEFNPPLKASLEMEKILGHSVESILDGEGYILDLSLKGAKLATSEELPINRNTGSMTLSFEINEGTRVKVKGDIIWKNKDFIEYHYGILFIPGTYSPDFLLQEIKYYAKRHKK